jgi:hypothetical protein
MGLRLGQEARMRTVAVGDHNVVLARNRRDRSTNIFQTKWCVAAESHYDEHRTGRAGPASVPNGGKTLEV